MGTINYRKGYAVLVNNAIYSPVVAERLGRVHDKLRYVLWHPDYLTDAECRRVVVAYRKDLRIKSKLKRKG